MPDIDLSDDMLKLVRSQVLFVKRGYETAFPAVDSMVYDNLTPTGFSAWKVAEFIEQLRHTPVPWSWGGGDDSARKPKFPSGARFDNHSHRWMIHRFDDSDLKYLRVSYDVLNRSVREDLRYEENQLDILAQIRDRLPGTSGASGSGGSGDNGDADNGQDWQG